MVRMNNKKIYEVLKMNKIIRKKNLENLIETHLKKSLLSEHYEIKTIKASKLLIYARFDLAFKLLYLEMKDKDVDFAKEIYAEHIRAFSLGKFTEPGNKEKNSLYKFEEEFHNIFKDIENNGFDNSKTLIPLSSDNCALNGAHRISSAIYLKKEVDCVSIDRKSDIYDYKYFYNRNVSTEMLDVAATKFVEYAENLYIAFLWPTAQGHDEDIETIIPNIVYRKEIILNQNGAHNLLSQIYYGEEWLGSIENDFRGSQGKLVECFRNYDPIRVIAFQANSLDEVLNIKDKVRKIFNVGKHSIHITDTKEEAIRVARMVFNDNAIHFLNYAKPNKYLSTHQKIDKFKAFIQKNELNLNDMVLDSGIILSIYGLREANDIDYFIDDNRKIKFHDEELEFHDKELEFHDEEKLELIYNPKCYFYFYDIKFISFHQLYKMKKNRSEEKDINDYKMMEAVIENNKKKQFINKWKQKLFYAKIKFMHKFIDLLKQMKLYNFIRFIYRFLKGKK